MSQDPVDVLNAANANIQRLVLDNGLTVLLKEDRSAPLVALQYWVGAGAIHEGDHLGGGLSHYLEHMVFKGTDTRAPGQVSTDIADAGGFINAYTSNDRTVFHATLPAERWLVGLEVLTDAVFRPSFPPDEWEREREVILREVDMSEDNPGSVLNRLLWETAFRTHPYRVPVIGWRDILVTMTRDHLVDYHRRHYSPDNLILAIAGDIPVAEMAAAVREHVGAIPRTPRTPAHIPPEPTQMAERYQRRTGPYQITRLAWVFHTTDLAHPDTPALDVLASAVSSGRASPLVRKLLEEDRLVHQINAWSYTPKDPGLFGITAECDPDNEAETIAALRREVARWQTEPFDATRIQQARREVVIQAIHNLATMDGQAASMASGEFYAADPRHIETYIEQVRRVTPEDLTRVARHYLRDNNGTWTILAPEGQPEPETQRDEADTLHVEQITLPNSLRLIVREDSRLPLVHVAAVMGGGLLAEAPDQAGIAQLCADLLTRGTSRHSAAELAERLEARGIALAAFSGRNTSGLNASGLSEDLPLLIEAVADCLLDPQFPNDELDKQRALQLAAIQRELERPMTHAQQMVRDAFFPNHPYRHSRQGTPETVSALTREAIQAHHQKQLGSSNLVLAVFGDVHTAGVQALIEKAFAPLPTRPAMEWPALPAPPRQPQRVEQTLPFKQTVLVRAWPAIPIHDPRNTALEALVAILSGLSSDLFIEVRDKRGLAYYIGANQLAGPIGGLFQIFAGTTDEGLTEVETQIQRHADILRADGPRAAEVARAIEQLLADLAHARQNNAMLAQQCAIDELLGLGYRYSLDAADRLKQLDTEAIRAIAEHIFTAPGSVTAIVHPADTP